MHKYPRHMALVLVLLYSLSSLPINASAQVSDYNVCNFSQAPLRTTSSTEYYGDTLECDYTAIGDYERWEDYRIDYISSSDYYQYYIYISADKIGSFLWLKLSEYNDDWDGVTFDVDLELYGPDGYIIDGSYAEENIAEYVSTTVTEIGYYKVRVDRFSGSGYFKLERVLTENKGPTGNLFVYAPKDSLFMHEQISFDACDSYDVGGSSVYFDWFTDGSLQSTTSCELNIYIHDSQPHEICVKVRDYYYKEFTQCKTITARDPFSGTPSDWDKTNLIDFDSNNVISMWDKSGIYKAPGLDFWFKLGIRNDYKVTTMGSWEIETDTTWNDETISTTFSIENVDTTHAIYLRPTLTFEYYSTNLNGWQTLDIPMMSSEPVYSGQPSIEFSNVELYYWNDFVRISDNAIYFEDYYDSNSFLLVDAVTLSEIDLYPLVRELLDYGTQGVSGASTFLDFMEEWTQISIPLSYDLVIGLAGVEYTGLLLNPVGGEVVNIELMTNSGWEDYVEEEGTHLGNQIEIYELILATIPSDSDLADLGDIVPSKVTISTIDDHGSDQVEYRIMQYSDIMIYNYQTPSLNVGIESSFGDTYWTIVEFAESESMTISRTTSDANLLLRAIRDSDDDGVKNVDDDCPLTPTGEAVDGDGCSQSQLDDDGDGVMNDADDCPLTTTGEAVDDDGCAPSQLDDDYDGVMNDADNCPLTPIRVVVDTDGCPEKLIDRVLTGQGDMVPIYGISGGALFVLIALFAIMFRSGKKSKRKNTSEMNDDFGFEEPYMSDFNSPPVFSPSPYSPMYYPVEPPFFELKGDVDSDGWEWLEYNGVWWWRNSPSNHWEIYKE